MRGIVYIVMLVTLVGCDRRGAPTLPNVTAPAVDLDAVLKPLFHTADGSFTAGTAYLARVDEDVFAVSASHLFSEAGGLAASVPNPALPSFATGATFARRSTRENVPEELEFERFVEAGPPLLTSDVPGASPHGSEQVANDVVVFAVDRSFAPKALPVRRTALDVGEPVWLAASLPRGADVRTQLWPGVVVKGDGLWAVFPTVDEPAGASGAPIVDAKGQVVGHLARASTDGAELYSSVSLLRAIGR